MAEPATERAPNVNELVADRLFKARTVIISGEINQKLAASVTAQLLALAADSNDPITVFINSQGGHVESGDMIHDMLRFLSPRIRMVGTGWVASAGALIYVAVPREDRVCLPNTRFLLHQPAGGAEAVVGVPVGLAGIAVARDLAELQLPVVAALLLDGVAEHAPHAHHLTLALQGEHLVLEHRVLGVALGHAVRVEAREGGVEVLDRLAVVFHGAPSSGKIVHRLRGRTLG